MNWTCFQWITLSCMEFLMSSNLRAWHAVLNYYSPVLGLSNIEAVAFALTFKQIHLSEYKIRQTWLHYWFELIFDPIGSVPWVVPLLSLFSVKVPFPHNILPPSHPNMAPFLCYFHFVCFWKGWFHFNKYQYMGRYCVFKVIITSFYCVKFSNNWAQ